MKKLVAGLLVVAMILVLAGCSGNAVPDFDNWGSHQLGHVTVRVPGEVEIGSEREQGLEVIILESTVTGASVAVLQMVDIVEFLRGMGAQEEHIMTDALHGALDGGIRGFLAEAGGAIHGESEGMLNGLRYYRMHGFTDLNDAYFEARAFVYGDDFYIIKLFWNEDGADVVEPFFQSIQFGG